MSWRAIMDEAALTVPPSALTGTKPHGPMARQVGMALEELDETSPDGATAFYRGEGPPAWIVVRNPDGDRVLIGLMSKVLD
jgi:hypothetical protein